MNLITKQVVDLLNKVEPLQRLLLICVPLRMIRVIATDDGFKTFRVEQLVITNKDPIKGNWTTLSTHSGLQEGSAYSDACKAAHESQKRLHQKLQQRRAKLLVPA